MFDFLPDAKVSCKFILIRLIEFITGFVMHACNLTYIIMHHFLGINTSLNLLAIFKINLAIIYLQPKPKHIVIRINIFVMRFKQIKHLLHYDSNETSRM